MLSHRSHGCGEDVAPAPIACRAFPWSSSCHGGERRKGDVCGSIRSRCGFSSALHVSKGVMYSSVVPCPYNLLIAYCHGSKFGGSRSDRCFQAGRASRLPASLAIAQSRWNRRANERLEHAFTPCTPLEEVIASLRLPASAHLRLSPLSASPRPLANKFQRGKPPQGKERVIGPSAFFLSSQKDSP